MGLGQLCAVLSVDAEDPVVLRVKWCALGCTGVWSCCLFVLALLEDCMSGFACQQVESVALLTNLQVEKNFCLYSSSLLVSACKPLVSKLPHDEF